MSSDTKYKEMLVRNIKHLNENYIATSGGLIPVTEKEINRLRKIGAYHE